MELIRLVPPPRVVPVSSRLAQLFGGPFNLVGWLFFAFGSLFVWVFAPMADLSAFRFQGAPVMTEGRVTACTATNMSENKRKVYKIAFVYAGPDGREASGASYTTDGCPSTGEAARVELGSGGFARLEGYRGAPFSFWVLPFVSIFPTVGLCFAVFGFKEGRRRARLLEQGLLAKAKVAAKEPTNTSINNQRVWKMTLEFTDRSGVVRRADVKTEHPQLLEDDERETVLYDPEHPTDAAALDVLPGGVQAASDGTLEPAGRSGWLSLLAPLAALAVNAGGAYLVLGR